MAQYDDSKRSFRTILFLITKRLALLQNFTKNVNQRFEYKQTKEYYLPCDFGFARFNLKTAF